MDCIERTTKEVKWLDIVRGARYIQLRNIFIIIHFLISRFLIVFLIFCLDPILILLLEPNMERKLNCLISVPFSESRQKEVFSSTLSAC